MTCVEIRRRVRVWFLSLFFCWYFCYFLLFFFCFFLFFFVFCRVCPAGSRSHSLSRSQVASASPGRKPLRHGPATHSGRRECRYRTRAWAPVVAGQSG